MWALQNIRGHSYKFVLNLPRVLHVEQENKAPKESNKGGGHD